MKVILKNDIGMFKEVKVGLSWTSLFFGAFTPLVRGDWIWFIIQLVSNLLLPIISHIIFWLIYNRIYINSLLEKGYKPADETGYGILRNKGFMIGEDINE